MTDVKINVTFVIPKHCKNENECSEDMLIAYTACENHRGGGLQAQWVHEKSVAFDQPFTKSDIFVLSEFEGEPYEKLKATKCLLVPLSPKSSSDDGIHEELRELLKNSRETYSDFSIFGNKPSICIQKVAFGEMELVQKTTDGHPKTGGGKIWQGTELKLVGPRCLSCSLTEGSSIPTKGHPVYTIAMRGLIVSLSGLSKELKTSLKQKIEWMGGTYSAVLSSETTHLIANSVFSDKYMKAAERGIPVMKDTWVAAVWDASLKLDINGASSDFDSHRLPPFANLQITTSGLNSHDKKLIMKLVNANGGDFSRTFLSQTTNVLVLTKESTSSEKYKAALEFGKVCVTPHWVEDSAALGFALPAARYRVTGTTTSSPVRDRPVPDMSLNLTRITRDGKPSNFVDESKMAESMMLSGTPKIQRDSKKDSITDEIQKAFEAFDVASIKKAGPIFDGFCIWVSGLDGMTRDRAWACVSKTGGTRYDGPNARVTHAVSWGAAAVAVAAALPAVPVLSPLWLIRSVEAGRVLDEAEFVINTEPATPRKNNQPALAAASPMSKRTLQMLLPPRDTTVTEEPQRDHIVDHYLSQHLSQAAEANNKSPEPEERKELTKNDDDTAVTVSEFTQSENIFKGLVFEVRGLEDEAICEIGAEILAAGGTVAAAGAGGTHMLVPLDFHNTRPGAGEAVTVFWVKDCLSRQELTPIEYYHRPVHLKDPNANPLHGVVLSLSNYSGVERAFLDELAKLLGAVVQQRFCRRSNGSALASTHLVCRSPSGAKYGAARKWGVPVVRAGWLRACAASARRAGEAAHEVDADNTSETQNTLANAPPPQMPEPNKSIPERYKPIPETEKIAPEPEKIPTESIDARCTTPEALPNEDLDANLVPDVEQMLPEVGANATSPKTKKKYKKINNKNELFEGMSPASRFIAMRRMGMFSDHEDSSSKENTPKKTHESDAALDAAGIQTPPLEEVLSSPNLRGFSPNTRRRLQAIRRGEVPDEPIKTPVNPFDKKIVTPDSDFGAMLRPGLKRMSVDARKLLWEFVDGLPTNEPRRRASDLETPPSKMAKLTADQSAGGARLPEPTPPAPRTPPAPPSALPLEVDEQLQRLNVVLTGRRTPRRASRPLQAEKPADMEYESGPESQPNTVGWDDTTPSQKDSFESVSKPPRAETVAALERSKTEPEKSVELDRSEIEAEDVSAAKMEVVASQAMVEKSVQTKEKIVVPKTVKRFMLSSNVDNREETIEMILRLGGEVTDLDEQEEAPPATHLLCCAPARSQRVLNCIACGCWVLHPAYVARSAAVGMFLQEEAYEWGNPLAASLPAVSGGERVLAAAAHRVRTRRAAGLPGPFAGVVALLHAPEQRRKLLARLVKAGEGTIVDEEPPYTDESINVCFADPKRYPMKERDRAWLVSRRVPVCASILLSAFLTEENRPDLKEHCLPEFKA